MFGWFHKRSSIIDSELLKGATDHHCHILYGLDDGVRDWKESSEILTWLGELGLREVWFTPHVMEDVPNTTEGLQARFAELSARYEGPLKFRLSAEYMMDNLFAERLRAGDLLCHGGDLVLVETSTVSPPYDFWETLERMMSAGYRPLIAHPERYRYMREEEYRRLKEMGCRFQLNLPSIVGYYGSHARQKAEAFLKRGWYDLSGSDCHRFSVVERQYSARELGRDILRLLQPLMEAVPEEI